MPYHSASILKFTITAHPKLVHGMKDELVYTVFRTVWCRATDPKWAGSLICNAPGMCIVLLFLQPQKHQGSVYKEWYWFSVVFLQITVVVTKTLVRSTNTGKQHWKTIAVQMVLPPHDTNWSFSKINLIIHSSTALVCLTSNLVPC